MKPVWWPWPTFHPDPLDICRPPCSFAICHCSSICSRTMPRLALLRHLSLPWAADVLLCWPTKEHDMRLVVAINLCVLEHTLQEPNAYSYLESSQTEICCALVKADLSDWKFSFQNNCKYLVRLFVVSINLRCQIFVRATPASVQITRWLQISGLLGRIAIFNWEHVWSFCYFKVASTCSRFLPNTC